MRRTAAGLVAGMVLATACARGSPSVPEGGVLLRFGEAAIAAEVVADTQGRQRGLMHREHLETDAGMLFLFALPQGADDGFWMRNTLIPLSIAYMLWEGERRFRVVAVLDMTPCRTQRCKVYNPGRRYDAALEVNRGWFDRHGVARGSTGEAEGELPTPT